MSVEKLQRVMWRLRAMKPGVKTFTIPQLEKAIILECGHTKQTYRSIKRALTKLGWIASRGNRHIRLTDVDLSEC